MVCNKIFAITWMLAKPELHVDPASVNLNVAEQDYPKAATMDNVLKSPV